MRVAWGRPSATVRDVVDVLSRTRRLAYTTVMTVMGRLAHEGLLVAHRQGRSYSYRAALTREEFEAHAAGRIVRALLQDFGGELALGQFVKTVAEADPAQLGRLAELARRAQESRDGG